MDLATLSNLSLVVAGDFMVTGRVQPGHRRAHPLTTINSLSHTLDQRDRFPGIVDALLPLLL